MAPRPSREQAWKILLPAPPAADAVMDDRDDLSSARRDFAYWRRRRAVSEPAMLSRLARDTGETRWTQVRQSSTSRPDSRASSSRRPTSFRRSSRFKDTASGA
jgi:hypothetical protein